MPLVWDILHASMNPKGGQFNVASLENMEKDHSFLFLKKNLMKIFFFFWGKFGNPEFFEGIENFDFFFLVKNFKGIENFD